jgi:small subunit ribosomal protein S1
LTVEDMEGTEPAEAPTGPSDNGDAPTMTSQDEFPAGDPKDQRSDTSEPTPPTTSAEPQPVEATEPANATATQGDGMQTNAAAGDDAGAQAAAATTDDEPMPDGAATAGEGVMASQVADIADTADDNSAQTHAAMAADEFADAPPAVAESETEPESAVPEGPEPTTMEELLREQPGEIRSLKHGDVVEGTVVRIDKDEILVDIGAKSEGVVSNRELYGRNAEVQPVLNIGDQVLVYVLQPESQEGHAVLSLRRAGLERKWRSMQEQLDAGAIIEAPVIDHNKGGLIVDCGIRGFVPISQIVDFPRRPQNEQPRDAAQEIAEKLQPYVGRKLRLKILEVNRKANRLILSEKVALYEERREKRDELFSSLQVGQKVTGTVRSIAPFGVFIDLGGIDGLVHKSELSWNKVNNPEAGYKIGEEVEAEVIDVNHERGRISLSIRRLQPDPWHSSVADLNVGDIVDGTVTKIVNFGAFVRVRDGLEGLIHISELSHQRIAHPGDVVHEGQHLKLKVISLDSERHRLGLSLKQAEEPPARPVTEARPERRPRPERGYDASQAIQEPEGGIDNTLAAAFAQVRQQLEESEAARRDADTDEPEAVADSEQPAATAEAPAATADAEAPSAQTGTADAETPEPAKRGRRKAQAVEEAPGEEEAEAEPAADAQAVVEPAAETEAEPATEAKPEAEPEPVAEAKPETEAPPATETEAEAEAAADQPAEGADDAAPVEGAEREEAPPD